MQRRRISIYGHTILYDLVKEDKEMLTPLAIPSTSHLSLLRAIKAAIMESDRLIGRLTTAEEMYLERCLLGILECPKVEHRD